jgi:hypothetical protein
MKIIRPIHKIAFYLSMLFLISANSKAETKNLCSNTEVVYFSCETGKKIISLCSSSKVERTPYMEYRYGTNKKVELKYRGFSAPNYGFYRTEILYASNSSKIIWFKNQDTNYLLNLPMRGGPILHVEKEGKTIAELSCKGGWGGTSGDPESPSEFIEEKLGGSVSETQKYWSK